MLNTLGSRKVVLEAELKEIDEDIAQNACMARKYGDDFFTEGDEGNFLTEEEELGDFQASVEDAPMEDFVPGDDAVPGDEDGVPGDEDIVPGDAPLDIAASAPEPVDEDMVATEAGQGSEDSPIIDEPEVALVGNEDLESAELTSGEVAREVAAEPPADEDTEVEDADGEAKH